jgi:hypothetical protein
MENICQSVRMSFFSPSSGYKSQSQIRRAEPHTFTFQKGLQFRQNFVSGNIGYVVRNSISDIQISAMCSTLNMQDNGV